MKNKYRANSTDVWKRPLNIRYVWYVETEDKSYSGTTWNSLEKAYKRSGMGITAVKVMDVIDDEILDLEEVPKYLDFLEHWRDNYHNIEWKYIV